MVSVDRLQRWYPETMASSITSACVWLSGVLWMIFWADGIRNIGKGKGERGKGNLSTVLLLPTYSTASTACDGERR